MAESTSGAMMSRAKLASVPPKYYVVRRAVTADRLKSRVHNRAANMGAQGYWVGEGLSRFLEHPSGVSQRGCIDN